VTTLKVLCLNCSLKQQPEPSETEALARKVLRSFQQEGLDTEILRLSDYTILPGTKSNMGLGDQWPEILDKIRACHILIIATPIWMGHSASYVQRIFERLDDIFYNPDLVDRSSGRYFTYNKVGAALVTGNEDGAHEAVRHILWGLQEFGFSIPPNSNSYWVGVAGGQINYTEGGGEHHEYTNKNNAYLVMNSIHLARVLQEQPFTTDFKTIEREAKKNGN